MNNFEIDKLQNLDNDLINTHPAWQRFARNLLDSPAPAYKDMNAK